MSHISRAVYGFDVRRHLILVFLAVVLVSACSQQGEGEGGVAAPGASTGDVAGTPSELTATTTTTPALDTTTATETTRATSDRPMAPDFTLELGEGGSYTLSEGSKPVYLVFWAEW
jgi:hypothetical protein